MGGKSKIVFGTLVAAGASAMVLGLILLVPALKEDQSMMAGAGMTFSFGAFLVAGALYFRARGVLAIYAPKAHQKTTKAKIACTSCGVQDAVVRCTPHAIRLCSACMAVHDQPQRCLYVPASRRFAST